MKFMLRGLRVCLCASVVVGCGTTQDRDIVVGIVDNSTVGELRERAFVQLQMSCRVLCKDYGSKFGFVNKFRSGSFQV